MWNSVNIPSIDYYLKEPFLLERHNKSRPPNEAFLFIPDYKDTVIVLNEKNPKKTLRRIFEMKFSDFITYEEEKKNELDEEIVNYNLKNKNSKLEIPTNYRISDIYRYLQATGFNCAKTIQLLKENLKWRAELLPPKISSKIVEILNCGFMYIHGRDNCFRPIMVINASYYMRLKDKYIFEDWLNTVIYFMEYTVNNLLIPGQIENWNIITDLSGVSIIFMPGDLKKVINVLQANYRCRLYVNYIIGMSTILRGVWSFVKSFLDETTVHKIRFMNDSTKSEIFTFISKYQVEKRFGGNCENIVPGNNNCFPPIIPQEENLFIQGQSKGVLLSEENYKQMYLDGKLTVVSEFYLNKWKSQEINKIEECKKNDTDIINIEEINKINDKINIQIESQIENEENILNDLNLNTSFYDVNYERTSSIKSKFINLKRNLKIDKELKIIKEKVQLDYHILNKKGI